MHGKNRSNDQGTKLEEKGELDEKIKKEVGWGLSRLASCRWRSRLEVLGSFSERRGKKRRAEEEKGALPNGRRDGSKRKKITKFPMTCPRESFPIKRDVLESQRQEQRKSQKTQKERERAAGSKKNRGWKNISSCLGRCFISPIKRGPRPKKTSRLLSVEKKANRK